MPTLSPIRPGTLFIGTDFTLRITVTGLVLTGLALQWVLRRHPHESGAPLVSKTTGAGTITLDGSTVAVVAVTAADTAALLSGTYHHTLTRTDASNVTVLSYGWAVLEEAASP